MKFNKIIVYLLILLVFLNVSCGNKKEKQETTNSMIKESIQDETKARKTIETIEKSTNNNLETNTNVENDINQKEGPSVPLQNINLIEAEQGIQTRKTEKFFEILNQNNLVFSYQIEDFIENENNQYIMAFTEEGFQYSKIITENYIQESLALKNGESYLLNSENKTAISIQDNTEFTSFQEEMNQILKGFKNIYYLGEGKAEFLNKDVSFEEYTTDNRNFIRYYFLDNEIVGYRVFDSQGTLNTEMIISVLSNDLTNYLELFSIPDNYSVQDFYTETE